MELTGMFLAGAYFLIICLIVNDIYKGNRIAKLTKELADAREDMTRLSEWKIVTDTEVAILLYEHQNKRITRKPNVKSTANKTPIKKVKKK